jgi:hypothetical protein
MMRTKKRTTTAVAAAAMHTEDLLAGAHDAPDNPNWDTVKQQASSSLVAPITFFRHGNSDPTDRQETVLWPLPGLPSDLCMDSPLTLLPVSRRSRNASPAKFKMEGTENSFPQPYESILQVSVHKITKRGWKWPPSSTV